MKKSFIVIGLGRFGINVAKGLVDLKSDCLAIDKYEYAVKKVSSFAPNCAIADGTKIAALEELGVSSIDHAIVAIGNNLQDTILTVINLKSLGVKRITVRIDSDEFRDVMMRLGATEVIIPEEASAIGLANQIRSDTILDYYKPNDEFAMATVVVGEGFEEKPLIDLDWRKKFDINIIGVTRHDVFFQPKPNDVIKRHDVLTVFGADKKISKFDNYLNK